MEAAFGTVLDSAIATLESATDTFLESAIDTVLESVIETPFLEPTLQPVAESVLVSSKDKLHSYILENIIRDNHCLSMKTWTEVYGLDGNDKKKRYYAKKLISMVKQFLFQLLMSRKLFLVPMCKVMVRYCVVFVMIKYFNKQHKY